MIIRAYSQVIIYNGAISDRVAAVGISNIIYGFFKILLRMVIIKECKLDINYIHLRVISQVFLSN